MLEKHYRRLSVFDRLLGEEFLNFLFRMQELEWWLHNAVKDKGEVYQQSKPENLEPLEGLPAQS